MFLHKNNRIIMGKMEVYENGFAETLNPWWDDNDFIYNELKQNVEKIKNK